MDTILMERTNAGLTVRLLWNDQTHETTIAGLTELAVLTTRVDPARALDAFEHPCAYLEDSDSLFREPFKSDFAYMDEDHRDTEPSEV